MKNKKRFYTISFIIYSIIIFGVSSYPRLAIPIKLHSSLLEPDKIAHFIQYFIFALLYFKFRQNRGIGEKEILCELFFLGMLIPIFDELHQILIPGRTFEWYDVVADLIGFYTFIISKIIQKYILRRKNGNH